MNTSKVIDISKSSLVGLKAELLKKQEEVKKLKELQKNYVKPEVVHKKKSVLQKSNAGIDKRCLKDSESVEEDYDALKKSREVLEAKCKLYDKLKEQPVDDETKSKYLIDFDLKREIEKEGQDKEKETCQFSDEENYLDTNSDPENDWVDFIDSLGRSRRCLRKDLPEMKAKDAKLAESLKPPSPPPPPLEPTPELLSWDMQREMMRKKWEEQETLLLGKKDIHYQDIRFDEARPHGVGYFEFSTEESERIRQQQELMNMRKETVEQQQAAEGLRARRQQQMQARLAAARQRRRQRLGLPPESPPHEADQSITTIEEEKSEESKEEQIDDLQESIKKIAPVRPWDIGKEGVAPIMSQEEWIEKKRLERPEEFAPPSSLLKTTNLGNNKEKIRKPNFDNFLVKKTPKKILWTKNNQTTNSLGDLGKEEMHEIDRGESYDPLLENWNRVSQENTPSAPMSNKVKSHPSSDYFDDNNVNNDHPSTEYKDDIPELTMKSWKPSVNDIDELLLKSRKGGSVGQNLEAHNQQHPTLSSKGSQEEFFYQSQKADDKVCLTENIETIRKQDNCEELFTKNNERKEDDKYSMSINHNRYNMHSKPENIIKSIVNLVEIDNDNEDESSSDKHRTQNHQNISKRKYAEIPPPSSMSYYTDTENQNRVKNISTAKPQLADSISAGFNYLKTRTEEKSKKRIKGLLNII